MTFKALKFAATAAVLLATAGASGAATVTFDSLTNPGIWQFTGDTYTEQGFSFAATARLNGYSLYAYGLQNPHNADLARRKAYTARTFKVPSMEVAKRTNGPTDLSGQRFLVDIIPLGGGVPINVGNDTIGALGISGSPTQEADEKCANAAIASVAAQLR